jgi:uridine kinase
MAQLQNRITFSLEDLEEQLGESRLPVFVRKAEEEFINKTREIADYVMCHPDIQAVFVSGPTSSGKTTFTDRLASCLFSLGKSALRISLDDYYNISELKFDIDGRPDYESLATIDAQLASENIQMLLNGESVQLPVFDFHRRERNPICMSPVTRLDEHGIVLVEGLHGLSPYISGQIPRESWLGIFIMPWGDVVSDRRLIESQQVRLLRRIVRDVRHRPTA